MVSLEADELMLLLMILKIHWQRQSLFLGRSLYNGKFKEKGGGGGHQGECYGVDSRGCDIDYDVCDIWGVVGGDAVRW